MQSRPSILRSILLLALAAVFHPHAAAAQERREDMPVTPVLADSVARAAAGAVSTRYVFVEKGATAARTVLQGVRAGRYRSLATASALTDSLTGDLRRATGDAHLQVVFSVRARTAPPGSGTSAADLARDREAAAWRNYGFHQVERLDGNVGYLELGRFDNPELAGSTLAAAMTFLAGTDALVIDLRGNGGGFAAMQALVLSYFFAEPTLLTTLHRRDPADVAQLWTLPHVAGPRYLGKPVYVLVSGRTFSAAEGLAYHLQAHRLATVVGEKTRGGANPGGWEMIGTHFGVFVPTAWNEAAATRGNWEGTGITPDLAATYAEAKKVAHRAALAGLIARSAGSERAELWKEALQALDAAAVRAAAAAR
ncbi:MAG: S41 family peptidase [Longimicrobiaceae bacterium]